MMAKVLGSGFAFAEWKGGHLIKSKRLEMQSIGLHPALVCGILISLIRLLSSEMPDTHESARHLG
jgi:hypothetical protein